MTVTSRPTLSMWASSTYSQNGEDGMIAEILRRLEIETGTCVEVGAHDGFTFSNTAALWHDRGWRAALLEPNATRVRQLRKRTGGRVCTIIDQPVGPGHDDLATLLDRAAFPLEVDLLSIDVDGPDVEILRKLGRVIARVIVCEYNPTIPWPFEVEGTTGSSIGASLATVVRAAEAGGYAVVGITTTNVLLVRRDDIDSFADLETAPQALADLSSCTFVVSDYAGRAAIVGPLPFRYRPGALELRGARASQRHDLRLRWTLRGAVDAVQWKVGNIARQLRALPKRDAIELIIRRARRSRW